ncbi:substrate-binding domain-containing protein, partial [Shewanella sp. A25]|nr:substrate-binding domain-containing protein [Shewanella shenzhenensis]
GSSTAPPALTEGTSQFGPMSRAMKPNEEEAFEKHYGYKPTRIRVAIDALALFVHKDNPIKGRTVAQIDGIFSATHKCYSKAL